MATQQKNFSALFYWFWLSSSLRRCSSLKKYSFAIMTLNHSISLALRVCGASPTTLLSCQSCKTFPVGAKLIQRAWVCFAIMDTLKTLLSCFTKWAKTAWLSSGPSIQSLFVLSSTLLVFRWPSTALQLKELLSTLQEQHPFGSCHLLWDWRHSFHFKSQVSHYSSSEHFCTTKSSFFHAVVSTNGQKMRLLREKLNLVNWRLMGISKLVLGTSLVITYVLHKSKNLEKLIKI